MSRTGNAPIKIPEGIDVTLHESHVTVKGNSGETEFKFSKEQSIILILCLSLFLMLLFKYPNAKGIVFCTLKPFGQIKATLILTVL